MAKKPASDAKTRTTTTAPRTRTRRVTTPPAPAGLTADEVDAMINQADPDAVITTEQPTHAPEPSLTHTHRIPPRPLPPSPDRPAPCADTYARVFRGNGFTTTQPPNESTFDNTRDFLRVLGVICLVTGMGAFCYFAWLAVFKVIAG